MTRAQQALKADRFKLLSARLEEIQALFPNRTHAVIEDICQEISTEIQALHTALHTKTEYVFNFIGGGWNTIHAYTIEEAITKAQEVYDDKDRSGKVFAVDTKSFRVAEKSEVNSLIASFY